MVEVHDLERRQDDVIRQLDELIGRLESTLSQWNSGRLPAAEVLPFPMSPADQLAVTPGDGNESAQRAA